MILINLLPEDLRIKEVKHVHIPYRKIAIGVFAVLFLFTLYNLFFYIKIRSEYHSLDKKWKEIEEKSGQADALEKELGATITAEVDFYDTLVDPTLQSAKVMNVVSDLLPKQVWLSELKFARSKKDVELALVGLSGGNTSLVEIQNYANTVKAEMEKSLVTAQEKPIRLKASVVTTSQKGPEGGEVTQMNITIKNQA